MTVSVLFFLKFYMDVINDVSAGMRFFIAQKKGGCVMEKSINTQEVTINVSDSFKAGKVNDAIIGIMDELKVAKNGKALDKEGKLLYTFIQLSDLREALQPLLKKYKCVIRKGKSKNFRDRKQNPWGNWVNIDVIETPFILQSLEDGSYLVGYGKGEGSDWGSSASRLASADAYKDFIGTTFCLVTDDELPNENMSQKPEIINEEKQVSVETTAQAESQKTITTPQYEVKPSVKLKAPEPTNPVVQAISKNISPEEGEALTLPEEAVREQQVKESVNTDAEPVEPKEVTEKNEPAEIETQAEPKEPTEDVETEAPMEPEEDTIELDEKLKKLANIICPIANRFVNGKTFEEICTMALTCSTEAEQRAKDCVLFVARNPERFSQKAPQFAEACKLAVQKFGWE